MTFKRVTSAVAGDATHFGGLDVNKFSDIFGGTDIAASETLDINTATKFRDSKLRLRNIANSFEYTIAPSAITGDRTLTLPQLASNDIVVTAAFPQTVTNKTMSATNNTFSNIGDTEIIAHTTTKISTLNKALLNTAILYNDQNTDLGAFYQDMAEIAVPANPAAGRRRIFVNTGNDDHLSVKTSSGGTVDLESSVYPDVASGGNIWGVWVGGARQGSGLFAGATATGTLSSFQAAATSDKPTTDFATSTTTGSTSGFQGGQPTQGGFYTCRNQNFRFKCKIQMASLTNKRMGIGFAALNTLPATDTTLTTAIPGFIFRYSSTTDTTWKIIRNDTSGSMVTVDTTVTPVAEVPDTLEIIADEAGGRMGWSVNGSAFTYYTTDIPIANTYLNYFVIEETKTTAVQRARLYYAYITQAAS